MYLPPSCLARTISLFRFETDSSLYTSQTYVDANISEEGASATESSNEQFHINEAGKRLPDRQIVQNCQFSVIVKLHSQVSECERTSFQHYSSY